MYENYFFYIFAGFANDNYELSSRKRMIFFVNKVEKQKSNYLSRTLLLIIFSGLGESHLKPKACSREEDEKAGAS